MRHMIKPDDTHTTYPPVNDPANAQRQAVDRSARDLLRTIYGYDAFRGEQEQIINAVTHGEDALVLMPTGGGKSLCYQIPSLLRDGVGIIISPLIALMQDQVRALHELGVRAAFLNSTLGSQAQQEIMQQATNGELNLLYIAPERLLQESTLTYLQTLDVALFAIDEAHCVSSWGHDFRQDYLGLHVLNDTFPNVPRVALTATADQRTREDIVQRLALRNPRRFVAGFDRPNICYSVQPKTDAKRQLLQFLEQGGHTDHAGIVYCLSRKSVEATAHWLSAQGYDALPYHAGMPAEQRHDHQERFLREDKVVMVATIAFGMGIDKPDVRFVAHLDLPKSVEAYYQETGRAGRDGAPADAMMLYGLQDVVRLSRMVDESVADDAHKRIERAKLDGLLGWCEVTSCRRRDLLAYFGDELDDDCGNCDTCIKPPITWDGTEAAQKALSCVYRCEQRFGAGHIIDVLRGSSNAKVTQFGHESLSTFGIGKDISERQWRSIFRQLVVRGFLVVDHSRFGALRLAGESRGLLKGELTLNLREDPERPKRTRAPLRERPELDIEAETLFETLKSTRLDIATAAAVPPYVVFHDATLLEMVEQRPRDHTELLAISGVGESKLQKYGSAFLDVLAKHTADMAELAANSHPS